MPTWWLRKAPSAAEAPVPVSGLRILFVTQYGVLAASSRTRVFDYLPSIRAAGHECEVITVLPDAQIGGSQILVTRQVLRKLLYYAWAFGRTLLCGLRVLAVARRSDLVFVQKVIFPSVIRRLLARVKTPFIYDFDDAIFTTEVRQANWLAARKQERNARGMPAMLRMADLALVENQYTERFAREHCRRVEIITGPIDTQRYAPGPERTRADSVVLGWIGSASTLPYLEALCPALEEIGQRFDHVCLHVVGAREFALTNMPVETKAWSLDSEVGDLRLFDIGLMPIPDDVWTRGKGGYKLLQYMAVGLPVITSPVGINCQIVEDGKDGFWARAHGEWVERMADLVADAPLRRQMGQAGRAKMEDIYSLEKAREKLLALMGETASGTP